MAIFIQRCFRGDRNINEVRVRFGSWPVLFLERLTAAADSSLCLVNCVLAPELRCSDRKRAGFLLMAGVVVLTSPLSASSSSALPFSYFHAWLPWHLVQRNWLFSGTLGGALYYFVLSEKDVMKRRWCQFRRVVYWIYGAIISPLSMIVFILYPIPPRSPAHHSPGDLALRAPGGGGFKERETGTLQLWWTVK